LTSIIFKNTVWWLFFCLTMRGGHRVKRLAAVAGAVVIAALGSCGDRQEAARKALDARDFRFTVEEFMRAAREGDAAALGPFLDAGMNVDVTDAEANTALFLAASHGHAAAVKLLLSRGANPNVTGTGWDTPLIVAARSGSVESVEALLAAGAQADRRSEKNWTALSAAAYAGHADAVKALAPRSRDSLDEALQIACLKGETATVDALLGAGASVFSRSKDNKTPLMYAAMGGHVDAVRLLIINGANRFALDSKDRTAADHAATAGHDGVVAVLNDPESISRKRTAPASLAAVDGREEAEIGGRPTSATSGREETSVPNETKARPGEADSERVTSDAASLAGAAGTARSSSRRSSAVVISTARAAVPAIDGARLAGIPSGDTAAVQSNLQMRDYRETQLPIVLEGVGNDSAARIRVLYRGRGEAQSVAAGDAIGDTGLELVRAERKFRSSKGGGGELLDVSQAVVRDRATGHHHLIVRNLPAHASEASAVVGINGSDTVYEVRAGDEFTAGASQSARFRVLDVRPTQVVIENSETGETLTLPHSRRAPK
jgi:ankyrin repeat protein